MNFSIKQKKSLTIREEIEWFIKKENIQTVVAYKAFSLEPDLSDLFSSVKNVRWIVTEQSKSAEFIDLKSSKILNDFRALNVDLVLVPGVAFSLKGKRLGRGGGYYDRLISTLDRTSIKIIGVCFKEQLVPVIPSEKHDELMDKVIYA